VLTSKTEVIQNDTLTNCWLLMYSYDSFGNQTGMQHQMWFNDDWLNYLYYSNAYDAYGNLLNETQQYWHDDAWENTLKMDYTFGDGFVDADSYEWNGSSWAAGQGNASFTIVFGGIQFAYYYVNRLEYYYSDLTGVEDHEPSTDNSLISCFPNPVNDLMNIEFDAEIQNVDLHIELYDQKGMQLKSFFVSGDCNDTPFSMNIEDLPSGLYFLRITAGDYHSSQKVVVPR